ncbi:MAG: hypothetical protein LBL91_02900 [Lachnospiraceae bacterium]|jgi:hypothetical protein|nr:hypothetical protein [Lachnospiraceae bacterium]
MMNLKKRYITILVSLVAIGLIGAISYFAYQAINASTDVENDPIVNSLQIVKAKSSRQETTVLEIDKVDSKKLNISTKLEYVGDAVNVVPTIKNTSESNCILKNIKLVYNNPDNDIVIRIPKITNGLILKGGTSEYALVVEWRNNNSSADEKKVDFSIELEYEVVSEPEQTVVPELVEEPATVVEASAGIEEEEEEESTPLVEVSTEPTAENEMPEETASSTSEEL